MTTLSTLLGTTFIGNTGPAGSNGAAATVTLGTVTTGAAGSSASITNSGTSQAAVLNFTIPRGDTGAQGVNTIPQNSQTSAYQLAASDIGKHISITTGGITVPSGVFSAGDAISIFNNSSSSQTITSGAGITMYLGGTSTTGNRTLAQYGICTVLCVASNTFVIFGAGLT